ncbi:MAG: TIR domain-containing protein [Chloroflexota bacterium]|nr:TIR domain-containing protein [Chloroflexota bacterium]
MAVEPQYHVFLSYSRADEEVVRVIARRLGEEARLRLFLDRWHLIPGAPWQEAIEEALERSETVAVFVGPSGISPWHNEEMRAGLDRAVRDRDDVRIIPVLLPGAEPKTLPSFLVRRTYVDFRAGLDDADAFARLVAGILGQPPEEAGAFTLPDGPAPYPGLQPFTIRQADFFFGRTDECNRLLDRARYSPFVAVVGASGSGKSSLVLAGLLPRLDQGWRALTLAPGAWPLRALADQLAVLVPPADRLRLADDLETRFTERAAGLSTAVSTLLTGRLEVATLLIVVDQFEELFTQVAGTPEDVLQQRRQFIANLMNAVHTSGGRVRVVLTLRADFVRQCLEFPELRALLEPNQLLLGPMGEDELREAIVKPAHAVGAMFEKGLVARIVGDMREQPAALPLLQFALAQLWQRRHGVWLTHAAYEEVGGLSGAIDQRADAVYRQLSGQQRRLARNLFVRLVALGEDTGDTRRRVRRDELKLVGVAQEEIEQLIGILSRRDVRLIASDAGTVELAHEALIEQWGRLRDWLDKDRAGLLTHRRLTETAVEWDRHGRDPSYLYRGTRLSAAEEWANAHADDLNLLEQMFLGSSISARRRARARRIVAGLAAALVLVGVMTMMITERGPFAPSVDWSPVPDFDEVEVSSLVWGGDGTLYAGLGAGALPTSSVARSRDDGVSWEPLDVQGEFVTCLLTDPGQANVVYVALDRIGLFRSRDGGNSWSSIGKDLPMSSIGALAVSPAGVLYAGDNEARIGVYASRDGGEAWSPLQGSPKVTVYFLSWSDERLLVGTEQGLWQWTTDGQWANLFGESRDIFSVVSVEGVLFAGGDGIFELREDAEPRRISPEQIYNIDMVAEDVPRFVASTIDGSVLQWRLGDEQVETIAHSTDLSEAAYIYVVRAQLDDPVRFWAGTENGLQQGEIRRWFEAWRR